MAHLCYVLMFSFVNPSSLSVQCLLHYKKDKNSMSNVLLLKYVLFPFVIAYVIWAGYAGRICFFSHGLWKLAGIVFVSSRLSVRSHMLLEDQRFIYLCLFFWETRCWPLRFDACISVCAVHRWLYIQKCGIGNEPCCGSSLLSSAYKMSLKHELKIKSVTWGASS